MSRSCTVCGHRQRSEIDRALVDGAPIRDIAGRFGLTRSSVARHKAEHLPAQLLKAKEAASMADGDDLLNQVAALRTTALSLLLRAEQAGDFRTALAGIREARGCIEIMARMVGELQDGATVNIITPAWLEIRRAITDALAAYPEVRVAVAERLAAIEASHDGA